MEIKQSYYLFVLLLASLTVSCTSNCPITNQSVGNAYQECAKLYAMLETALFENQGNLYQLHDRFFPSSGLEPIYAKVFFELNNRHDIHWTSSVVLRSVRPAVLASFHMLLLNILLPYDLTDGQRAGITHAQLFIKPTNFTESDYPDNNITINAVLRELTSWLKVYANTQQRRSHWEAADHMYKGYSCEFNPSLEALLISIAVLTVALTTIALIKAVPKFYRKVASHIERGNQWYSFFWAASFMASVYNIYNLCVVLWALITFSFDRYHYRIYFLIYFIRIVVMSFLILFDILVAIFISKRAEFPIPSLAYILSFLLCCTCCCCSRQLRSKWIQTLALSGLLLFLQLIALSALPTILWAFILPIQTLAAITFFAAAMFCITALIAVLLRNIGLTCSKKFRDNRRVMQPLLILMVILFLAIVILTFYIYLKFITTETVTNHVGGFIVSFLPSAVLTIIGWFVAKGKFIKLLFPQESDSIRNESQPDSPTELQSPVNT